MNIIKNVKKITLGILGTAVLASGLLACSNNDTSRLDNNTKRTTQASKIFIDDVESINLDLKEKLNLYKSLLNENDIPFVSENSVELLNKVLGIDINGQPDFIPELTKNQEQHINNLSFLLSNSESPEMALEILEKDYDSILNSKELSDEERTFLLVFNNSVKTSTEFVLNEFNYTSNNLSKTAFVASKKSWWDCVKKGYADLTDNLVGSIAIGLHPGPCIAVIVIGGTINYYRQ